VKELDILVRLFQAYMLVNEWLYTTFPVGADLKLSLCVCMGLNWSRAGGQEG